MKAGSHVFRAAVAHLWPYPDCPPRQKVGRHQSTWGVSGCARLRSGRARQPSARERRTGARARQTVASLRRTSGLARHWTAPERRMNARGGGEGGEGLQGTPTIAEPLVGATLPKPSVQKAGKQYEPDFGSEELHLAIELKYLDQASLAGPLIDQVKTDAVSYIGNQFHHTVFVIWEASPRLFPKAQISMLERELDATATLIVI